MLNKPKITGFFIQHEEDLLRAYTEPSYYVLNADRKPNERLARFLQESIEDSQMPERNGQKLVKQRFRLSGLVKAYDIDARYTTSEARAVRALYGFIKRKTENPQVLKRLESDYQDFCENSNKP